MTSIFRLLRIGVECFRLALGWATERLHLSRSAAGLPDRLCLALGRLGPAFVKFGQALSLRQEMMPDRYIVALQSLQDRVTPFPGEQAMREVERGLGVPLEQLFAHIDQLPLAAASIAQVHAARLHDGREVIVKVRRVGIEAMIDRDMRALRTMARIALVVVPHLRRYQPLRLIDEVWANLRKETDFRQEARNIRSFSAAFADWPTLHVPRVIDNLVSERVVVQERSAGLRIDDPQIGPDGPRLAQDFVEAYLHQIFVLGIFHGDPHPGNLFITSDGRICFHDFGLTGFLDRNRRRQLAALTDAFIRQDADWLLDAAIDLGILAGEMDREVFRRGITEIVNDYAALPLREWSLADAFLRVARLGRAQNIFVPYDLAILMRAMFLAEHAVRLLDPEFQLLGSLQAKGPEMLRAALAQSEADTSLDRLKYDAMEALQELPALFRAWVRRLGRESEGSRLVSRLQGLERLEERLERSSNRRTLALITVGLYIAGSLLMQRSLGPRVFGDVPTFALLDYALALWFTFRVVRAMGRPNGR